MRRLVLLSALLLSFRAQAADVPGQPYSPDDVTSLLIHFDEGTGNVARDASEFSHVCTVSGAQWIKGKFGNALDFRHGGYAFVPASPSLQMTKQVTIELWLWVEGPSDTMQRVAFRSSAYGLHLEPKNSSLTFFLNAGPKGWESISARIPTRQWVHVAGVYDGHAMSLFVNGERKAFRKKEGNIVRNSSPLFIGANDLNGKWPLRGAIDELRISQIARKTFDPQDIRRFVATATFRPIPANRLKISLNLPVLAVPKSPTPRIDGTLNDQAWRIAGNASLTNHPLDQDLSQPTKVFVAHNARSLFVAFRCREKKMSDLITEHREHDSPLYTDDCVEIFLQPNPNKKEYYHIVTSPLGVLYDASCGTRTDVSWESNATVAAKRGKDEWTVEMSIPLKSLGLATIKKGTTWRGNFCREERPHNELSSWARVGRNFHQPERFGKLVFGARARQERQQLPCVVRGLVRDEKGKRVQGVLVTTPFGETRTDALGFFNLKNLPRGEIPMLFKHPRYVPMAGIVQAKRKEESIAPPPLRLVNPYRYTFKIPHSPKGYVVVPIDYLEDLDPNTQPAEISNKKELKTFATPGEYEPLSFVIYAQKDLGNVRIDVSGLRTDSGQTLPSSIVDQRWVVRYLRRRWYSSPPSDAVFVSRYLVHDHDVKIAAETFRQVWLSLHVPGKTPAGVYRGTVTVRPQHAAETALPIELRVLPFTFVGPNEKAYGLYYHGRHPEYGPSEQEQVIRRELRDIREHGATLLIWGSSIRYEKKGDRFRPNYDDVMKKVRLLKDEGFVPPYIVWAGLLPLARQMGHQFDTRTGTGLEEIKADEAFHTLGEQGIRGLMDLARRAHLGEIALTESDEVFSGKRLDFFIECMKIVRRVKGVRIYCTFHNAPRPGIPDKIRKLDPYVDIRCYHGHVLDEWIAAGHSFHELAQELRSSGDEAWTYYNPRSVDVTPEWTRIINGIWLWASPIRVHCPWIYNAYSGNPLDDMDGHDYGYAFPVGDEIVPTRLWEAYREGVDDTRYLSTLKNLIANGTGTKLARARAQVWLNSVPGRFLNIKHGEGQSAIVRAVAQKFSGDDYQRMRWECAEQIMNLLGETGSHNDR